MNLNEYFTNDLAEASVLRYSNHVLSFVDKSDRRAKFVFIKREDTEDVLDKYRERVLQVEPYAFFQCIRDMKDRLYQN